MKTNITFAIALVICSSIFMLGCDNSNNTKEDNKAPLPIIGTPHTTDSVIYSFAFMGCNRVDRNDKGKAKATNASSANVYALKRIYDNLCEEKRKPDAFFFLGDLVVAEQENLDDLKSQLKAWVELYDSTGFSDISTSGIELVALPGNHEMLYYANYGVPHHDEWPLDGAEDVWIEHMAPYMPKDRDIITGADSMANRSTFSFVRKNIGFIVMNTDTYNPSSAKYKHGMEGLIPTKWITQKIEEYRKDSTIKHIFVLGHKPYYVYHKAETGHNGLPEGPVLWPALRKNNVVAMLSAHVHDYQRMQPMGDSTYQIIAGNGGSPGQATFFGYTTINVYASGKIELKSKGYKIGHPYYAAPVKEESFSIWDSTLLTPTPNANPYKPASL
ncbi:MAG: metallophosphoesterase [Flavipsychrobacter sp.]